MAETGDLGEAGSLAVQIEALRASGAAERNPVRFAYLEAMARRAALQPEDIRRSLEAKLSMTASELAKQSAPAPTEPATQNAASPLAELLAYISQQAHAHQDSAHPGSAPAAANLDSRPKAKNSSPSRSRQTPELKSVTYFRNEWSKLRTEQQLTQTLAQAPANAGPMNSQHLVLRSLQIMRDIAPDYLQGFMSYIDTLIWLEHADPTKAATTRAANAEGEKKPRSAKRGTTKR